MSAVCGFSESNGVGESVTDDISNVNFGSDDSPNLTPITYPITAGTNSFAKFIRALFTGTWTDITNMKFWKSSGVLKTGETIKASANATYATPSQSDTGDSNIPTAVESALALNSAEEENHIEYGASGVSGYTGYLRLQLQTTGASPSGAVNQKVFTIQWDET